jgi:exodeoxyribonuclease V gamma subunit
LKPKDWLRAWIHHLALCASAPAVPITTVLAGQEETMTFQPLQDAPAQLAKLLALYWRGLEIPLPFFPRSALAYAQTVTSTRARSTPLEKARKEWNNDHESGGEKYDASFAYCFGNRDPIDAEFEKLATEIFVPILNHATPAA